MNTNDPLNPSADQSSTGQHAQSPTDTIAISALELARMIQAGQGTDVNELVNRVLNDRLAA